MELKDATILTAMITPFDENGAVNFEVLPDLIEYLLEHHTEGLIVSGTTGESPTLSEEEKLKLFKETVKIVDGRVPIVCGVGSNNTAESVAFAKKVAEIEGVAAGLCVVPYYNKPSQEGLYQHFKAIAEASSLPVMLYNVPGRTVANMEVATTLRLAELPNVIGVKECHGLDAISEIIEQAPADFLVYSGEDGMAMAARSIGGNGIISVASHVAGDDLYEIYQALEAGDLEKAGRIHRQFVPKYKAVFSVPSPAPVKAVLNHLGLNVGAPRLPLVACTPEETQRILNELNL
ncbi:4-hydroxy-tetrahydrodipicolinate synthase [Vagococcus acidifermentans]|uniref:4-hydroxy-tetrahydrodipicolinate synthase n=1 Tax=Vagococcus acidifermentans TaxID=564710 RepID=A0A430ASX4_9ENTE|nr:4-hydroxy-tetrahydrodipicolinate synthase [Vagococcus acidifermentans]RSU11161.1 4-hydroxy-tetrahydrodipicolinate synthase [Vagococcus acidifermentans]